MNAYCVKCKKDTENINKKIDFIIMIIMNIVMFN